MTTTKSTSVAGAHERGGGTLGVAVGILLWCLLSTGSGATPLAAQSQWHPWWFEGRGYYEPLVAGVREPHMSALWPAWAGRMEFMVKDADPRMIWDIDVGYELPLGGVESGMVDNQGRVAPGAFGVGVWFPIDFHMVMDFVDDSSPIINTDYRFGPTVKAQFGVTSVSWLGLRLAAGHESTHLGDEFSIVAQRTFPTLFERINVSWEYIDVGTLYERDAGDLFWSARLGTTARARSFRGSYYSIGEESISSSPRGEIVPSRNWIDPYGGFDVTLLEPAGRPVEAYLSAELRWRSVYDYHRARAEDPEERQASVNLIVGVKRSGTGGALGRASMFGRFYHGVNPHGQFRNQRDYTQFGIGLRMVR
jgi:hypothetical protein